MQNDWMNDESLKNIEPYKLQFLQALVFESSNLKKEQMLPFLMAVMKRGKEKKRLLFRRRDQCDRCRSPEIRHSGGTFQD